jgi:cellulose synthase/poly-beta-1,6-N-acetylglucosamine synthase-like glycosyltransferase
MESRIDKDERSQESIWATKRLGVLNFIQPDQIRGDEDHARRAFVEPEVFMAGIEDCIAANGRGGSLAYIEIIGASVDGGSDKIQERVDRADHSGCPEIINLITEMLGNEGIFCWHGGRYILLINRPATLITRQILSRISRAIAAQDWSERRGSIHLTPAIGFVDMRMVPSVRELWVMAETALDGAKSSLEIEPYRYIAPVKDAAMLRIVPSPSKLWQMAPRWLILSVQLVISLVLGLGAPFILYAVCDALGFDISGPVYIGVVIVLVLTAAMIWVEGFFALKPTEPPEEPGSPYPLGTVIIPAYLPNEADTIMETLHAFLNIDYPNSLQVIVAYNGPAPNPLIEDEMAALAASEMKRGRFLIEPLRVHGSTSKAQNVNAAIGRVQGRFVGIFDADHHPRPDSIARAWRWLSNGWDIVQGRCSVRNGSDGWVSRMVAVEFEQIYAVSHPGRARFHSFGIFGGSNGFWRTSVLHETRMRRSMLTEDIDSSIRAVIAGYKIAGDRDLISEELAPTTISALLNQRLRWAQGWFQVSLRRVLPALMSRNVTLRQKMGICHLLIWRELFPWYSIQVMPIMFYWVWVYGWSYIHWTVPIFLATTVFTFSTGPSQLLLAYVLAQGKMKQRPAWFVEYLFVSLIFYAPFKDALSRIAHIKEAMRERSWKVTPRTASPVRPQFIEMGTI